MKTKTDTLIKALRILANDIQSEDGVGNAAIAEAAERLDELERENAALQVAGNEMYRILTIPGESDFKDWATEPEIDRAIAGWREAQP
jgi:hypothetical protein